MVGCSFIYPCWTGAACCSLLTWTETKWVRQLIIHGAIISRINMMITWIVGWGARYQLQIPPHQEKDPPKRDWSHPKNSLAHSLRSCRRCFFEDCVFLEDCETFFNLAGGIYPEMICLIQGGSSPSLFRDQEISCLFWSTTSAKLCWLFRAILRNLIPRN